MPQVGLNTVYECVLSALAGTTTVKNVFYYASLAVAPGVTDWAELATLFAADVLPEIADCVTENQTYNNIAIRRLDSIVDFGESAIDVDGTRTGLQAPSYVAASIKLLRTTKEVRNGRKQIGRLAKDDYTGDAIGVTLGGLLVTAGARMDDTLNGATFDWVPVIVGNKVDSMGNPVEEANWLYSPISGTQAPMFVTTQNTRKVGVGE